MCMHILSLNDEACDKGEASLHWYPHWQEYSDLWESRPWRTLRPDKWSEIEGGQGRSNPTCMQVIIHAQEWMALHRRQQEGKDKISGLVLQTIIEMKWRCEAVFQLTNKACVEDLSLASLWRLQIMPMHKSTHWEYQDNNYRWKHMIQTFLMLPFYMLLRAYVIYKAGILTWAIKPWTRNASTPMMAF